MREKPKFNRNKFLREAKERKKNEAQVRNENYSQLTVEQKIEQLDKYGLVASKQRRRLEALRKPSKQVPDKKTGKGSQEPSSP